MEGFDLRKLVVDSAKCTGCGTCEEVCSAFYYKAADKEKSAIRVSSNDDGGRTATVCDQCGSCKDMCSVMALDTAANGVVRLNKKICVGCLICVGECLRDHMRCHDDLPTPFKCCACGLCAKQCPSGALSVSETQQEEKQFA
ncbi:MAG: 4Fe-4S binding protein [Oscillospiraceae bacterium]|nr:4Fe-4S binding protein [Oscillospiraceae bacterium]